ncbi:alpha/beta family hydrolase [Beijerinckia sp. L45]|uniref:alpha/beta hydrolase family protein n=1 Tax=Beijerinckia sp. L45 TaxID=1641855 RepID=UPI00131E6641|nr:alpha/beta family hydrolase [Beijerinckia sp. L45]
MLKLKVDDTHTVSAVLRMPAKATACYVVAHGAGAGMTHPFMVAVADGLLARGIATLRYQFPFMDQGLKRPDRPALAHATVRAAVAEAARLAPSLPLFAGGKSFGGRMTSQAQAEMPMASVRGLIFLGFPLHQAKKPSADRADHLAQVRIPMLFLQGTRDALADLAFLEPVVERLGSRAMMMLVPDADHAFHVPKRSGRTDAEVLASMLSAIAPWIGRY